jgi:hypothetical protein
MKARPRRDSYSPTSANWTLYDPQELADNLGLEVDIVDRALEKTGFNKAVRIREDLIKRKTALLKEQKELFKLEQKARNKLKQIEYKQYIVANTLVEIRNILRIPREKDD